MQHLACQHVHHAADTPFQVHPSAPGPAVPSHECHHTRPPDRSPAAGGSVLGTLAVLPNVAVMKVSVGLQGAGAFRGAGTTDGRSQCAAYTAHNAPAQLQSRVPISWGMLDPWHAGSSCSWLVQKSA